jgi:SNF2 family DNA or RNA helicase
MDLFSQIYLLDQGASLGRYITHYRRTYFYPSGYGGYDWKLQNTGEVRINAAIKPLVLRLSAEDYLHLPEIKYTNVYVDLPPEALVIYKKLEREFIFLLESGERISSPNAAALHGKCRQMANGGIYDDDKKSHVLHGAKTEALEDLVEELSGKPMLVGYEFRHDLERLIAAFPHTPYLGKSVEDDLLIIKRWNAGDIPLLFGQITATAHGLNLQGGTAVCFYSMTYNYESYYQFIRRVYRKGQTQKVNVYHLLALRTLDIVAAQVLTDRETTEKGFLASFKGYIKNNK